VKRVHRLGRAGKLLLAVGVAGAVFGLATAVQASIPGLERRDPRVTRITMGRFA
jgi:hypothetical protein